MSTFVLVHGAFHGGWVWRDVADGLRARGHRVLTPTLTGCGDRAHLLTREVGLSTHVEDLVATLVHEDVQRGILVGHSYGGVVVSGAADRAASRVARLVFLDAAAPEPGQASTGAFAEGTGAVLASMSSGNDWLLPPLPLTATGVTDPALARWVDERRHPHPMRALHEPLVAGPALAAIPSVYVQCTEKGPLVSLFGVDPLAPFVEKAKRLGWPLDTIPHGHDVMLTAPGEVVEVLARHAE